MVFKIVIIIAANIAVPKPLMINESPSTDCVIIRVIALITNKKSPNDRIAISALQSHLKFLK